MDNIIIAKLPLKFVTTIFQLMRTCKFREITFNGQRLCITIPSKVCGSFTTLLSGLLHGEAPLVETSGIQAVLHSRIFN